MSRRLTDTYSRVEEADCPSIALRVPGEWNGANAMRLALPDAIQVEEGGMSLPDGTFIALSTMPADDAFPEIFLRSHDFEPSESAVAAIARYTTNVCMYAPGGSIDAVDAMMHAAVAMLDAGGIGVFVDNSGIAHSGDMWRSLAGDDEEDGAYWAFVATYGNGQELWTIGMHVFGLRDAIMPRSGDDELDHMQLNTFLGYTYRSQVRVRNGDLIGSEAGPEFRVLHEDIDSIPAHHPMYNPYGRWRFHPVEP